MHENSLERLPFHFSIAVVCSPSIVRTGARDRLWRERDLAILSKYA